LDDLRFNDRVRLREDYLGLPRGASGVVIGFYRDDEPAAAVRFHGDVGKVPLQVHKVPLQLLEPLRDGA
jgi:hypothetical protein